MSANDSTASVLYTPRRSTRISRLDISAREVADLLASQDNNSLRIRRTPRKSATAAEAAANEAESAGAAAEKQHQSGGNKVQKNQQKKRNKKSKKQKAKANQKRREEAKKSNSQSSQESVDDVESSEVEAESGIGTSPTNVSEVDTHESAEPEVMEVEEVVEQVVAEIGSSVAIEESSPKMESGIGTMDTAEILTSPESPPAKSFNVSGEDVINLITPEAPSKIAAPEVAVEALEVADNSVEAVAVPDTAIDSIETAKDVVADAEKSGEDLNGTFEISEIVASPNENTENTQQPDVPTEVPQEDAVKHNESVSNPTEGVEHSATGKTGPRYSSTPARRSVSGRKSTPFKQLTASAKKLIESPPNPSLTPVIMKYTKTPLKSVLRGKRRSMSVDTGADLNTTTTTKKGVFFHSPSNTTIHIDEVDFIMKSKKKLDRKKKDDEDEKEEVRKPRRSMSLVETESEKEFLKDLQPLEELDKDKIAKKDPTPKSRVKLPNFTAIHKHQFEKMESIEDHVARKNERAKVLSASKPKSDQSGAIKKDLKRLNQSGPRPIKSGPKARQRIELSSIKVNQATIEAIKSTVQNSATVKPLTTNKTNVHSKSATETKKPLAAKSITTISKPKITVAPKPTSTTAAPHSAKEAAAKKPSTTSASSTTSTTVPAGEKKHMTMFKNQNRTNSSVLHTSQSEQQTYILGVRSNRRFVLQMQHRDKLK